jgi:hypothetical protein
MKDYRVRKGEANEDQVTAAIVKVTSNVPLSAYLAAAVASMVATFTFKGWMPMP